MRRLFFAIPIPPAIRRELAALRDETLRGARWVKDAQLHLTMRFVGEVDDDAAGRLEEAAVALAPWPPLELTLRGVGTFGRRVVFIAPEPLAPLARVAHDLEAAVLAAGLPPADRPFAGHVTLARLRRVDPAALAAYLRRHARAETRAFTPRKVILYQSTATPVGHQHEPLLELPFATDPP